MSRNDGFKVSLMTHTPDTVRTHLQRCQTLGEGLLKLCAHQRPYTQTFPHLVLFTCIQWYWTTVRYDYTFNVGGQSPVNSHAESSRAYPCRNQALLASCLSLSPCRNICLSISSIKCLCVVSYTLCR